MVPRVAAYPVMLANTLRREDTLCRIAVFLSKCCKYYSREETVPDIVVWVTKPRGEDAPGLGRLEQEVRSLDHVSEVEVSVTGSAIHVSFEGGKTEQEEIERFIQEAGYEIFKVSR